MSEFTRLADVELQSEPAETTNVLVETDGEVKKVPSSKLGGGGSGGYLMELEVGVDVAELSFGEDPCLVTTKNYDEMYEAMEKGGSVCIKLSGEGMEMYCPMIMGVLVPETGLMVAVMVFEGATSMPLLFLFANGSYH